MIAVASVAKRSETHKWLSRGICLHVNGDSTLHRIGLREGSRFVMHEGSRSRCAVRFGGLK